ncbi:uncharacterized protein LAESUDRAFT_110873 [Laetiporus sulphureus 93-53]|uniref:Uncharacterized protein n=1 Tax=Laetiporus sulphureus 93-53 TaxID=1314785 RepID=A0A165EP39_9APHY|nr:uncharacterized protein LAESUDRAFT_110873 [Laetiporus sulphureus 93-53]KZT07468.1 hypothetical protein LAESUDRAFT_110873 [Laetiporus sulphureus 93-53]
MDVLRTTAFPRVHGARMLQVQSAAALGPVPLCLSGELFAPSLPLKFSRKILLSERHACTRIPNDFVCVFLLIKYLLAIEATGPSIGGSFRRIPDENLYVTHLRASVQWAPVPEDLEPCQLLILILHITLAPPAHANPARNLTHQHVTGSAFHIARTLNGLVLESTP